MQKAERLEENESQSMVTGSLGLWSWDEAVHYSGNVWWEKMHTSWQPGSRKKRRTGIPPSPSSHTPSAWLPSTRPLMLSIPVPLNKSANQGPTFSTGSFWGHENTNSSKGWFGDEVEGRWRKFCSFAKGAKRKVPSGGNIWVNFFTLFEDTN